MRFKWICPRKVTRDPGWCSIPSPIWWNTCDWTSWRKSGMRRAFQVFSASFSASSACFVLKIHPFRHGDDGGMFEGLPGAPGRAPWPLGVALPSAESADESEERGCGECSGEPWNAFDIVTSGPAISAWIHLIPFPFCPSMVLSMSMLTSKASTAELRKGQSKFRPKGTTRVVQTADFDAFFNVPWRFSWMIGGSPWVWSLASLLHNINPRLKNLDC